MIGWDAAQIAALAQARLIRAPQRAPDGALDSARERAIGVRPERQPIAHPGPAGVGIDSRTIAAGELFVGLKGERTDGGAHAAAALRAGAWGVLVTPPHARALARVPAASPARPPDASPKRTTARDSAVAGVGARASGTDASGTGASGTGASGTGASGTGAVLEHADPLAGLQALAAAWRQELGARVVAITGSVGKTSTRDILTAILRRELRVAASPANYNTEIGLPLAILRAPARTDVLVLELAMRGPGQIAELTRIARPDAGAIVNIGPVHLELLGSREAVAAAKAELIGGLAPGSTIAVPADEPLLAPYRRDDLRTITFGPGGDVELERVGADGEVAVRTPDGPVRLRPSFRQAHNLRNLLPAIALAQALGVTPGGELDVSLSALRGEHVELPGRVTLINDCYNANPMSMRAALDDLARSAHGRRVAVLGDMLELGPDERSLHREVGAHAASAGVGVLIAVGPRASAIADAYGGEAHRAADAHTAASLLGELMRPGDTVLVKGSRALGLERVAELLASAASGASASEPARDAGAAARSATVPSPTALSRPSGQPVA